MVDDDDDEPLDDGDVEPSEGTVDLRKAARALARKQKPNISQQSRAKYRAVAVRDGEDQEIFFSNDRVDRPLDYKTVKEDHADDLVIYQVGDFFELYGEDAKEAASLLDLTLTTVGDAERGRVEMCGFPVATAEKYIDTLREKRDVAVCAVNGADGTRSVYTRPAAERDAVDTRDRPQVMDYDAVKYGHPEELVLYQVGDNYELRGEDAKEAARLLKLTEQDGQTVNYETTSLVSFPVQSDANVEVLRSSRDLVICTINEDGQREVSVMPSRAREAEQVHEVKMNAPDRFSVRSMGVRSLNFGIWDAALGRFYEEGNKIAAFVERDAAECRLQTWQKIWVWR